MKITQLLLTVSGVALVGCTNLNAPMSVNQDIANSQNFAAQVEDPNAKPGAPALSAAMSDAAIARYEAGEVGDEDGEEVASFTFNMQPSE